LAGAAEASGDGPATLRQHEPGKACETRETGEQLNGGRRPILDRLRPELKVRGRQLHER
jgi:hypothetical protein